jgi:hypothetical protein
MNLDFLTRGDTSMPTYRITRFYFDRDNVTVKEGLTLEEAQTHCKDPETSSRTATAPNDAGGTWFDGYEEE